MAKCPACDHEVRTPFFLNLDGWTHLRCTQCKARLEMKPPRSFVLGSLMAPLFVLARQGRIFQVIAFVYAFATDLTLCCWKACVLKCGFGKNPSQSQPCG